LQSIHFLSLPVIDSHDTLYDKIDSDGFNFSDDCCDNFSDEFFMFFLVLVLALDLDCILVLFIFLLLLLINKKI